MYIKTEGTFERGDHGIIQTTLTVDLINIHTRYR